MFKRSKIIRWHMLLAIFLLPLALIYFISGALYTLDIKGSIQKETFSLQLEKYNAPTNSNQKRELFYSKC